MNKLTICCIILSGLCVKTTLGQQSIDAYIMDSSKNVFTILASSSNSLSSPVDLDFYPNQLSRPYELWILNQGTSASGGSTVIVSDANKSTRTTKYVKDGNAWHFMAMASAIAFGDSLWVTSADILDANRQSGKYTGPTLWPGNLSIYGIVGNPSTQFVNGSHLDMIHQSPYSKGVAFERDLVYWVMDGYEGNLKRYDFVQPHQPGGEDHSAGKVRVYSDFKFTKHLTLPSHIVIDASKNYLYGCDPVGKRIFRVDITSGSYSGSGNKINGESLAEYSKYTGLLMKDIVTSGLTSPVGIDVYGDRLIVTDNGTDEIIIYDIANNYVELGRIKLKYSTNPDPMGIKIGPDGKIYFADKVNKKVYLIENSAIWPTTLNEIMNESDFVIVYPNPFINEIHVQLKNLQENTAEFSLINVVGEILFKQTMNTINTSIDVSTLKGGMYFLQVTSGNKVSKKKIVKQ